MLIPYEGAKGTETIAFLDSFSITLSSKRRYARIYLAMGPGVL